jgi:cell division FtsZ-interacting protein ZapD
MINIITYEQPLNERMRTFLRIKQLMQNFEHRVSRTTAWDTHSGLMLLLDITNLAARRFKKLINDRAQAPDHEFGAFRADTKS